MVRATRDFHHFLIKLLVFGPFSSLLTIPSAQVAELYPLIGRRRHDRAGSLSGGEQRIVELARALLLDPLLVLMDEPSIGLAPQASRQVFDGIAAMRQAGRTVLLVEQNARSGLAVADHGVVLEAGVVQHEGTGAQLLADPEVARLYLGVAATSGLRPASRGGTDSAAGT